MSQGCSDKENSCAEIEHERVDKRLFGCRDRSLIDVTPARFIDSQGPSPRKFRQAWQVPADRFQLWIVCDDDGQFSPIWKSVLTQDIFLPRVAMKVRPFWCRG